MRNRVLSDFGAGDAKKVEETVKTGYIDAALENLAQWKAVEEDLVETYGRLESESDVAAERKAFGRLRSESEENILRLSELRDSLEKLDKDRVKRIDALKALRP